MAFLRRIWNQISPRQPTVDLDQSEGVLVAMYHSIPASADQKEIDPRWAMPAELFLRQMRYLRRNCHPTSLSDAVEAIATGRPILPRTVAVTFDDGYLDNLTVAAPILAELNIPATIFIASGAVERREAQIVDRIRWIVANAQVHKRLNIPLEDGSSLLVDSTTSATRSDSFQRLDAAATRMSRSEREQLFSVLCKELSSQDLRGDGLTMSPRDIRTVSEMYPSIELAAHSVDHLDLTRLSDNSIDDQVLGSMAMISAWADCPVRFFACPYNRSNDRVRTRIAALGVSAAAAASDRDLVFSSSEQRWAIPRFDPARMSWPDTTRSV